MFMSLKRYEFEITHIIQELENIENGVFYEENRTAGTASARNIAKNVKKEFIDLLDNINNNKNGKFEERR